MNKHIKKICAFCLVVCMLVSVLPATAFADSNPASFVGRQLTLGDALTMHFYVSVDSDYTDSAVMTITAGTDTREYALVDMTPEEDGTYKFSIDLAAAQMTEPVMLTLTSDEETLAQKTYTVRGYAQELLEGNYSEETKALVLQLLNYGAKAQLYFAYNTDALANEGYELETAIEMPTEETQMRISGSVPGVTYYAASLVFVTKLAVRYYFAAPEGIDGVVFLVDGIPCTPVSKDDLYCIEVAGINPQELDQAVEIIVSDGENDLTVSYSPMCYITRMYNKTSSSLALKALIEATYGYHQAAAVFTGVVEYCTVSFSDSVECQQVVKGTTASKPETPVLEGYNFLGWYEDDVYYDFTQPVTEDIYLTAKWEEDTDDLWYDFSNSGCASVWSSGVTLTHLESYDGVEGVLQITNPGGDYYIGSTSSVNWPALYNEDSYADVVKLTFRLKIEGSALNTIAVWGQNGSFRKYLFDGQAATDGWAEFSIEVDINSQFDALNGMYLTFWSNGASTVYIDEISVVRMSLEIWNDMSDSAVAEVWTSGATLSYLESYDGAVGVLKMENTSGEKTVGNTNGTNWPAVRDEDQYANATQLSFRMKIEGSALNTLTVWGQNYAWSQRLCQDVSATDDWVDYTITYDGTTQFDTMNRMFLTFWSNGTSTVYIDQITVRLYYTVSFSDGVEAQTVRYGEKVVEPEPPEGEGKFLGWYNGDTLFDFSKPIMADISLTAKWKQIPVDLWNDFGEYSGEPLLTGDSAQWLESYDGAEGVVKMENTAEDTTAGTISSLYADIWCAPASVKVMADQTLEEYADVRTDAVYLDALKNEYETGQIILSAKADISFTVSVSELVNAQDATAVISSDNCTVYIQKYVTISNVQHGNGASAGKYPDALLPQENAVAYGQNAVSSGNNGGAWLSLYIPKDAAPGTYTGTATVTVEGSTQQQISVPISLRVYDVELSDETTSKSLFTINASLLASYEQDSSIEMYNAYVQFLIDHRSAPSDISAMSSLAEDGDSDMRVWAKTVWYWYEKGLRTIPLKASNETVNGYSFFNVEQLKLSLVELAKISLEKGVDLVALAVLYDWPIDEPFYVRYTAEHIQNNIDEFDRVVAAAALELSTTDGFDSELGQAIISSVQNASHVITDYYGNEFRVRSPMVFTDGTAFSYEGQNVALCPKFNDYNTEEQRAQYDLVTCEEKWWYGCNDPNYPYPSYHTEDTPVSASVIGWMMAQYSVTGNLYWAINASSYNGSTVSDPYSLVDTGTGANGEGILVYPGRYYGVYGPVGTIRLSAVLDGNEDYELIKIILSGYEARGISFDEILETITACVYDGTKVFGDSQAFEEARKALLFVAEQMSAGIYYSGADMVLMEDGQMVYTFTDNSTEDAQLSFGSGQALVGSGDGAVSWSPIYAQSEYDDAIALSFRMKVVGSGTADVLLYSYDGAWKQYGYVLKNQSAFSGWKDFTISVDVAGEYENLEKMFLVLRTDGDAVLYLDEITVVRSYLVTFSDGIAFQRIKVGNKAKEPSDPIKPGYQFLGWYDGDTLFDFTQAVTGDTQLVAKWEKLDTSIWYDFGDSTSASVWKSGGTLTWLESYDGAEGVLTVAKTSSGEIYVGSDIKINWPAEYTQENYENVAALKFRIQLVGSGYHTLAVWGLNGVWKKTLFQDELATDGWTEFTLSADIAQEYDALNGMYWTFWTSTSGTMYIDSITAVRSYTVSFSDGVEAQQVEEGGVATEPTVSKFGCRFLGWFDGDTLFDFSQPITADVSLTAKWGEMSVDMWYDFSDSSDADVWTNGATLTWLESYDDAEGVLKIDQSSSGEFFIGNTNGINWPAVYSEDDYADVIGLKIRVKIESSGLSTLAVWGRNYAWCRKAYDGIAATDGWVEFTIDVQGQTFATMNGIWLAVCANSASTVYIDEITVIRE